MSVTKLTPAALKRLAAEQAPVLKMRMHRRYRPSILGGVKRQTTRRGLLHLQSGKRIDFDFADGLADVPVSVTGLHFRTPDSLTAEDARREGLTCVDELQIALLQHYPHLQPYDLLTCIRFRKSTS